MGEPHESDVDYTAANLPDEDMLQDMMESALTLHSLLSGQNVQRRPRFIPPPDVRLNTPRGEWVYPTLPPVVSIDDGFDPPAVTWNPAAFSEAMTAAATIPRTVSTTDAALMTGSIEVIRSRVGQMRELSASADPVLGHALNSIDLGLVGLARVAGGEDAGVAG